MARIVLRNPARRNAMTRAMWRLLRTHVETINSYQNNSCSGNIEKDFRPIRCIIIAGEGGHFCAGGDISEYPDFRFQEESLRSFHEEDVAPALHALLACDVPIVAQIEGNCMGGGMEIAACCDMRIAGHSATFGAPIAKLGMPMAPQELAIMLRVAGEATVRQMLLTASILSAQDMQNRGFVHSLVPDAEVATQALACAQRIAALSPQAARLNKQAIRGLQTYKTPEVFTDVAQPAMKTIVNYYDYANHPEHIEGISAFLEKRPPQF